MVRVRKKILEFKISWQTQPFFSGRKIKESPDKDDGCWFIVVGEKSALLLFEIWKTKINHRIQKAVLSEVLYLKYYFIIY